MPSLPHVTIILLNYRGCDNTLACLDSLALLNYPNRGIIVVDNASPDDSIHRLQSRLQNNPEEFLLIESPENGGYSSGNNLGIEVALNLPPTLTLPRQGRGDVNSLKEWNQFKKSISSESPAYIWLLNNDTTVTPDSLTHLVDEAQRSGGLVGSLLLYPDGTYQHIGSRINWWTGRVKGYPDPRAGKSLYSIQNKMPPSQPPPARGRSKKNVEALSGASMLASLNVFQQVGLLDPSYFLYFEDVEFSVRCSRHGINLTVAPEAIVYHHEGASTGRKSLSTQYYYHRNRLRMLFAYAHPAQKLTISLYTAFRLLRSTFKSLCRGNPTSEELSIQYLAIIDFLRGISGPYVCR